MRVVPTVIQRSPPAAQVCMVEVDWRPCTLFCQSILVGSCDKEYFQLPAAVHGAVDSCKYVVAAREAIDVHDWG